jgi:hypothetical protein
MKRIILVAIASISLLSPVFAADDTEDMFVALFIENTLVMTKCPQYEIVPGEMGKMADKIGIDFDLTTDGVMEAFKMYSDSPYNRYKLIPSVTRSTLKHMNAYGNSLSKGVGSFCKEFGGDLQRSGFVHLKGKAS